MRPQCSDGSPIVVEPVDPACPPVRNTLSSLPILQFGRPVGLSCTLPKKLSKLRGYRPYVVRSQGCASSAHPRQMPRNIPQGWVRIELFRSSHFSSPVAKRYRPVCLCQDTMSIGRDCWRYRYLCARFMHSAVTERLELQGLRRRSRCQIDRLTCKE